MKTIRIELAQGVVSGRVAPGFEPVARAFAANFAEHAEVGAAFALYRRGAAVVDIWGGLADPATARPWEEDTVCLVFSAAKGPTATCVHQLIEAGQLDIDLPIAHYWPAFGCNGKEGITTRMVLCHQAGLAAVDGELSLAEVLAWDPVVAAIAAQAPNWEPGSRHGYHARSFGWILGELIRRISGEMPGAYLARHICEPLGLRYWVGTPPQVLPACAKLVPPAAGNDSVVALLGADSLTARVLSGPSGLFGYNTMWNRPEVLQAQMPSSNGVGDARSLARLYAALAGEVDGVRLLGPEQLQRACEQQVRGMDAVLFQESCFGLGFALQPFLAPAAGATCFGHPGAGGALAFADPEAELGFAYVMNAMKLGTGGDPRSAGLIRAVYECL